MFLLPHLKLIIYSGPETRNFLQGQLSCEITKLAQGKWVWGGYLTPKGRLLATFIAIGLDKEKIGLLVDASLVEVMLAKLKMYQLRAKTKFEIADFAWAGQLDNADAPEAGDVLIDGDQLVVGFANKMSLHCAVDTSKVTKNETQLQNWITHNVNCGYPWFASAVQEELTVHDVSLDLIGGVDFDKGCYVGQEIVIRAHHRGAIKRRLHIIEGKSQVPECGADILSPIFEGQIVGRVLTATKTNEGFIGTASVRKDASDSVFLVDGEKIVATAPPYGLFDDKFEAK